ncbi:hypothetical protein C8J56DRAFT_901614 [Mycena floridula]|nr:hypothetical protein C8J56DRAFT_901614 [Mycena floridula]
MDFVNDLDTDPENLKFLELELQYKEAKKQWEKQKKHLRDATPGSKKKAPAKEHKRKRDPKTKENSDSEVELLENDEEQDKTRSVLVDWSKEENRPMMEHLLTVIEDSAAFRQAFGFECADNGPGNASSGRKMVSQYESLAKAVFHHALLPSAAWADVDIKSLGVSCKNHIRTLKTLYTQKKATMKETGHGLVTTGHADELIAGSEISNAWDAIKSTFPWYTCMLLLYGGSPLVDRSAVANSTSFMELSIFEESGPQKRASVEPEGSQTWDIEHDRVTLSQVDASSQIDEHSPHSSPSKPPFSSQSFTQALSVMTPVANSKTSIKKESQTPTVSAIPAKRGRPNIHEQLSDHLQGIHEASQYACDAKEKGKMEHERMQLQFQEEESHCVVKREEMNHNFELRKLELQIELARIQNQNNQNIVVPDFSFFDGQNLPAAPPFDMNDPNY